MVSTAIDVGYRHIDTALIYGCQEEVGMGIKKSGINRGDIQITSKVAKFPPNSEGKIVPWSADNEKGGEAASIDKCLKML